LGLGLKRLPEEFGVVGAFVSLVGQANQGLGELVHRVRGLFRIAQLIMANLVHPFVDTLLDARGRSLGRL
jgi:hypothetical protein